ncbi:acryloyl-CoA reductase [Pseudogracilibacillus auburnensis]|uniref:Putative YhdH/YhfP family quinone oxidoreductase n=1 Tax=Pseudogracilibacillus auburnensis TaxID=1494959 RepID=A0A2V3W100_9BACI|nr:acryloyl-CoA reductase [Pseudogracilibacillus auburnensis]PXW87967.1 putative YhdH/YhfP family quinone oxidoreductase [Pseudogracilibacillus auburnensis]
MVENFKALVVNQDESEFTVNIDTLDLDDLSKGDVVIRVAYSSVNYKDGLAAIPNGNIVRQYPHVPGIDLAGTVVSSSNKQFKEGDEVIATSYEIGVSHYGGFSEYARIPADWIVPLPKGLTLKEAMTYGTAGFTAALSILRLEQNGLRPENGPVLVTGATGGVGSTAVAMLAKLGYDVVASTGKSSEHDYLYSLGAKEIISREELQPDKIRPLDKQHWAGAVDPVGGDILAYVLSATKYGGSVAVTGLTGGLKLPTTVFPFILRGVNLLGIDSVYCPMEVRKHLWDRMATDLKPDLLSELTNEITLDGLSTTLKNILAGKLKGRTVVKL